MVDIRLRYLDDDEADRLYLKHPELGRSPDDYCPTCAKTGIYRWKGADYPCDCEMQLQLHKHYLAAGIGATYQTLDWDDLENNKIKKTIAELTESQDFVLRGSGLILYGDLGTGKTMVATLLLKQFVRDGYSCFATTFSEMIEMYTAGWYSDDEKTYFNRKVVDSQVLLLDDLKKEPNRLQESTFDNVLRTRVQNRRSTIVTTNMTPQGLGEGYGAAALRLLREKAKAVEIHGDDFSDKANEREDAEKAAGERRPIL